MKLTNDEIAALKTLAQLAPAIVNALAPPKPVEEKKKRGRPSKVITSGPSKGGQNIPTEEDLENRPESPQGSGDKQKKEDGRHVRANRSKQIRKSKGSAARREPMKIIEDRPNLFDGMAERNSFKEDTVIDKKLWKGKQLAYRGDRVTLVAAECSECHGEFEVSPNEIKKDFDGNIDYMCNDCLLEKRQ